MSGAVPRTAASSGGYAKGRARREQIVAAAAQAYTETGYHGASLREIAKRAGISHAGLLYHFPRREALLAAVLERRDAQDAQRVGTPEPSPMDMVRHLLDLAHHNARHPPIVELYVRLAAEAFAPDHPAHDYFTRHYAQVRAFARTALEELGAAGRLREGVDPATAAVGLVALMDGLQVQWLTSPGEIDMAGTLRFFIERLLRAPEDSPGPPDASGAAPPAPPPR